MELLKRSFKGRRYRWRRDKDQELEVKLGEGKLTSIFQLNQHSSTTPLYSSPDSPVRSSAPHLHNKVSSAAPVERRLRSPKSGNYTTSIIAMFGS